MSDVVQCILQARVSSTRLPGKVLRPILGEPMLARQVERIRRARRLDLLTIATSDEPGDDAVAALCESIDVACHRGSLTDVLGQFRGAVLAAEISPDHVMRLTGDCPLTDPAVLDDLVALHLDGGFDYSSNVHPRTFPHGLDAEIFTTSLLDRAWREARTPHEREHVTPFMSASGTAIRRGVLISPVDRSAMRMTVDHPEDFDLVNGVYEALYPANPAFTTEDVVRLLADRPDIAGLNAHHASPPG